jgi:hypothetical protein
MIAMQRRRCKTCASRSSCISDEISLLMWSLGRVVPSVGATWTNLQKGTGDESEVDGQPRRPRSRSPLALAVRTAGVSRASLRGHLAGCTGRSRKCHG